MVQLGQGRGQVVSVDELVGGVLERLLPAVRRGRGRADEEQLAGVGQRQVLVLVEVQRRVLAEVDAAALAHDGLAVPHLAHSDGGLFVEEGNDDAAEGLEGRPSVYRRGGGDKLSDGLQVVRPEDIKIAKVGDQECVGRRCGLRQRGQAGKVELEGGRPGGPRGCRPRRQRSRRARHYCMCCV